MPCGLLLYVCLIIVYMWQEKVYNPKTRPGFEVPISPRVKSGWVLSLILEKWGILGNKMF